MILNQDPAWFSLVSPSPGVGRGKQCPVPGWPQDMWGRMSTTSCSIPHLVLGWQLLQALIILVAFLRRFSNVFFLFILEQKSFNPCFCSSVKLMSVLFQTWKYFWEKTSLGFCSSYVLLQKRVWYSATGTVH